MMCVCVVMGKNVSLRLPKSREIVSSEMLLFTYFQSFKLRSLYSRGTTLASSYESLEGTLKFSKIASVLTDW